MTADEVQTQLKGRTWTTITATENGIRILLHSDEDDKSLIIANVSEEDLTIEREQA